MRTRNSGFLSPEITLHGMHAFDDSFAVHTRSSYATNGATTGRERRSTVRRA